MLVKSQTSEVSRFVSASSRFLLVAVSSISAAKLLVVGFSIHGESSRLFVKQQIRPLIAAACFASFESSDQSSDRPDGIAGKIRIANKLDPVLS